MGADAEADEGLLAQAKDNDKISGYLGRWKASVPLSTDGTAAEIKKCSGDIPTGDPRSADNAFGKGQGLALSFLSLFFDFGGHQLRVHAEEGELAGGDELVVFP